MRSKTGGLGNVPAWLNLPDCPLRFINFARCAPPYEFFSACPCVSYQFAVSTPFGVHPSVHPRSWPRKVTAESRTLGNACCHAVAKQLVFQALVVPRNEL